MGWSTAQLHYNRVDNITMDDLPRVERDRVLAIYAACKRIKEASACYGAQQGAIRDAAAPVSYTHLDVYKRQAW